MNRLMEKMVRFGLVMACRLAGSPTSTSPLSVNATTLGVRRFPSWLGMTLASLPSMTATTEFVVPRSMPMIFSSAMALPPFRTSRPRNDMLSIRAVETQGACPAAAGGPDGRDERPHHPPEQGVGDGIAAETLDEEVGKFSSRAPGRDRLLERSPAAGTGVRAGAPTRSDGAEAQPHHQNSARRKRRARSASSSPIGRRPQETRACP